MRSVGVLAVLAGTATLVGCGGSRFYPEVAQRATFDLGCEVQPSDVSQIGHMQFGVEACGCRASYIMDARRYVLNAVSGENCQARTAGGEQR